MKIKLVGILICMLLISSTTTLALAQFSRNEQLQTIGQQQTSPIRAGSIICKTGEYQLPGYLTTPVRATLKLVSTDGTVNRVNNQIGYLQPIYGNNHNRIGTYLVRAFYLLPLNKVYDVTATWAGVSISETVYLSNTQRTATIEFIFMS